MEGYICNHSKEYSKRVAVPAAIGGGDSAAGNGRQGASEGIHGSAEHHRLTKHSHMNDHKKSYSCMVGGQEGPC